MEIDIGAHVDEDGRSPLCGRKNSSQGWSIDARIRAQNPFGGGHSCAGIAGGHEALGFAIAYQAKANVHGRLALAAYRLRGLFLHADHLRHSQC